MKKYAHSKKSTKPLRAEQIRELNLRKVGPGSTVKSVELLYGESHPQFGGSYGAQYDKATGKISKTYRAQSISVAEPGAVAGPTPNPNPAPAQTIKWFITTGIFGTINLAYASGGAYLPIAPTSANTFPIQATMPTDWSNVVDPNGMFGAAPQPNTPSDIAIWVASNAYGEVENNYKSGNYELAFLQMGGPDGINWIASDPENNVFIDPNTTQGTIDWMKGLFVPQAGSHILPISY